MTWRRVARDVLLLAAVLAALIAGMLLAFAPPYDWSPTRQQLEGLGLIVLGWLLSWLLRRENE